MDIIADGFEVVDIGAYAMADKDDISLGLILIDRSLLVWVGEWMLET